MAVRGAFSVPLHLPAHAGWYPNLKPERTTWKQPPDKGEQWEKKAGVKMLEEGAGDGVLPLRFPTNRAPSAEAPISQEPSNVTQTGVSRVFTRLC